MITALQKSPGTLLSNQVLDGSWEGGWAMSPKQVLQGAGKEQCCGYVQCLISIYRMRWLQVPALPHAAPSSKWHPHCAAPLQAYESVKWEKSLGKGKESERNWERNELNAWCKGKLQILETGANCPWQGVMGCDGDIDFTMAWADSVGCVDVAVFACGTLMTGLAGPILYGWWTISKMQMGVGVGSFEAGVGGKYILTGYVGGYCLWWANWQGMYDQ